MRGMIPTRATKAHRPQRMDWDIQKASQINRSGSREVMNRPRNSKVFAVANNITDTRAKSTRPDPERSKRSKPPVFCSLIDMGDDCGITSRSP